MLPRCVTTIVLWWLISRRCFLSRELATRIAIRKHCSLLMRNQVRREAFQQDLESIQVGTAGIRVDEHHAVRMRTIQEVRRSVLSVRPWALCLCVFCLYEGCGQVWAALCGLPSALIHWSAGDSSGGDSFRLCERYLRFVGLSVLCTCELCGGLRAASCACARATVVRR